MFRKILVMGIGVYVISFSAAAEACTVGSTSATSTCVSVAPPLGGSNCVVERFVCEERIDFDGRVIGTYWRSLGVTHVYKPPRQYHNEEN